MPSLADPELYLSDYEDRLVILDEIHRLPGIFQTLRSLDRPEKAKGETHRAIPLCSGSGINPISCSNLRRRSAGRIAYMELTPVPRKRSSWFPPPMPARLFGCAAASQTAFLRKPKFRASEWRAAFIQTYLERDVPSLGPRVSSRDASSLLADASDTIRARCWNAAQLAAGLGISWPNSIGRSSRTSWLTSCLCVVCQPWASNVGKRLVRSPKVYVRDSGLLHTLLGIRDLETLVVVHPVVGSSWGGNAHREHLGRSAVPANTQAWFLPHTQSEPRLTWFWKPLQRNDGQSR